MKIAIPLANNELSAHFGHCEAFAIFTVENSAITNKEVVYPSEQGCGALPQLLKTYGCNVLLAGGLGQGALTNLEAVGIKVVSGISPAPLEQIVQQYLDGTLESAGTLCDHSHSDHEEGGCGHNHV